MLKIHWREIEQYCQVSLLQTDLPVRIAMIMLRAFHH
jgi:hypothetical protein